MEIFKMEVGEIGTNCYLVYDQTALEGIVVDPGGDGDLIIGELKKRGLKITAVVNTHGHWDHIGANAEIVEATGAPLLIHAADAACLTDPARNMSGLLRQVGRSRSADALLNDGDESSFGAISLQVIHTPGHTPGGICLYSEKDRVLFCGDTLFQGSVGRTDFPGGSFHDLIGGIKEKLLVLPAETLVCPGHGPVTTVGAEKSGNSFLI